MTTQTEPPLEIHAQVSRYHSQRERMSRPSREQQPQAQSLPQTETHGQPLQADPSARLPPRKDSMQRSQQAPQRYQEQSQQQLSQARLQQYQQQYQQQQRYKQASPSALTAGENVTQQPFPTRKSSVNAPPRQTPRDRHEQMMLAQQQQYPGQPPPHMYQYAPVPQAMHQDPYYQHYPSQNPYHRQQYLQDYQYLPPQPHRSQSRYRTATLVTTPKPSRPLHTHPVNGAQHDFMPRQSSRSKRAPPPGPEQEPSLEAFPQPGQIPVDQSVQRSKTRYRLKAQQQQQPQETQDELPGEAKYADIAVEDDASPSSTDSLEQLMMEDEPPQLSKARYRKVSAPPAPIMPAAAMAPPVPGLMRSRTDPQLVAGPVPGQHQPQMFKSHPDLRNAALNGHRIRKEASLDSMHHAQPVMAAAAAALVNRPLRAKTSAEAQALYMQRQQMQQMQMNQSQQLHAQNARAEARQLLNNEAERQRQLSMKIKMQKEKQKAEEEEQRRAEEERARAEEQRKEALEAEKQRKQREEAEQLAEEQRQREAERAAELKRQRDEERAAEVQRRKEADAEAQAKAKAKARELEERQQQKQQQQQLREKQVAEARARQAQEEQQQAALAHEKAAASPPPSSSSSKERFGFLKKRKENEALRTTDTSASTKSSKRPDANLTIRPGGGGVVPGIDAPVSAVNAGERRVLIECNKSSILLPVTPTTTARDLTRSAATCLNEPINAEASVLLEVFSPVGVQRPLRHYEHVRDVLNSWDDDKQNSLVILPSATGGKDMDLEADTIAAGQPKGTSCQMFVSQKPGKWEKRWVTLRQDGQIQHSKKEDGKDAVNICHMSDFDIYTPNPAQVVKKIKPPKKLCFAIKSQQKSSIFLSTTNFVHFFSTGDKNIAATWYKAVQGWRSWYLVNVMGEGKAPPRPGGDRVSHYQLGSFKPLFDASEFGLDSVGEEDEPTSGRAARDRSGPPSAFARHLGTDSGNGSRYSLDDDADDGTFASTGLLGRSYSQRQRGQCDRDALSKRLSPFKIGGMTLLNDLDTSAAVKMSLDISRSATTASHTHKKSNSRATSVTREADLKRQPSTSGTQRPVVDLTPKYQEPPQHSRKGKGYVPEHIGPGGLIDSATSPDTAVPTPPATDWRARPSMDAGVTGSRSVRQTPGSGNAEETYAAGSLLDKVQRERLGRDAQGREVVAANERGRGF